MSIIKPALKWLKIFIILFLPVMIIVYLCVWESVIEVHYLCEISFDTEIYDVLDRETYSAPCMHCFKANDPLLYEYYLNDIFKGAKMSEDDIQNIKNQISTISDDKYIYVVVGSKLEYVRYSINSGYDGAYSSVDLNSVFIYWANKPLGNRVDGYI